MRLAVAVVVLLATVGGIGYGVHYLQQRQDDDRVWHRQHDLLWTPQGGCLKRATPAPDAEELAYARVECTSRDVAFVVLRRDMDHVESCATVTGAVGAVSLNDPEIEPPADNEVHLCLGRPGAAPSASVQAITAGRCVQVVEQQALPLPCGTHGAAKVLRVAKDIDHTTINDSYMKSSVIAVCGQSLAASTDSLFTWRLAREGEPERFYGWDLVFCLAKPAP